MYLDRKY